MKGWGKARKKPIEIHFREPIVNGSAVLDVNTGWIGVEWITTLEGRMLAAPGRDYVILGIKGEKYPIKKEIFNETYDILEEFCEDTDKEKK